MGNKRFLLALCVLSMVSTPLWASDKSVKLSTLIDYAPFCFKKGTKNSINDEVIRIGADSEVLQGYSWDIVRESYHQQGYTILLTVAPWKRSLRYMEEHRTDGLFTTSHSVERFRKYYYSREMIHQANMVVYVPEETDFTWGGLESLNGKTIAVIRGFNYGDTWAANKRITKQKIDLQKQGYALVDNGRAFGFAGIDKVNDHFLFQNGLTGKYKKSPPFDFIDEYIASSQTNPRAIQILDAFDAGKRAIAKNGTLAKIKAKWGVSD